MSGLPSGGTASLTLTGPNGFSRELSGGTTIASLPPATYTLLARDVTIDGDEYGVAPVSQSVVVHPGPTVSSADVSYTITTGRLAVSVIGVAAGSAAVAVTGPGGFARQLTGSDSLAGLVPGNYTIQPAPVDVDGDTFTPDAASLVVLVTPGRAATPATVTYAASTGRLDLTVTGVPAGAAASVSIGGPAGFQATASGSQLLKQLAPGVYTISATPIGFEGDLYQASILSSPVTVAVGSTPAAVSVTYAIASGRLALTVTGLPAGQAGQVTVNGPNGYQHVVTASDTLRGLPPGHYAISAANVTVGTTMYAGQPAGQSATVAAGSTAVEKTVTYVVASGSLALTVSGLPNAVSAAVTVTGPSGFTRSVSGGGTLTGLVPGSYTIAATPVSNAGQTYTPTPASQTKTVSAGGTAAATVTYAAPAQGNLAVTISGLPGGTAAAVNVTGPGGYHQAVSASQTLTGLTVGSYTVTASAVSSGGQSYGPSPGSQSASVTAAATATATVTYAVVSAATLDLTIDGMYLTQAAQVYAGTTPLITGRDAYLRVFVKANQANTAQPAVRVRLYSGSSLLQTSTIPAPAIGVPTTIDEGAWNGSWNLLVPAALVQPNLKILADVDPTNAIAEVDETDNTFPVNGAPFSEDIRTVPTWNVRLVPVLQQANGLQGDVTAGNLAQWLSQPLKMLPVATYDADIRSVYTTTAPALQSNDGNGAWGTILNELWALRSADGSNRYYFGAVKTSYGSGVAGMGYIGGGVNVSIGWDNLPSGSGVMAHEVGHNMGRQHSPCGGAANPDPAYPYAGGGIGIYGLDVSIAQIKLPGSYQDFMGYCNPSWVSDYVWTSIIAYRQSNPSYAPPAPLAAVSGLLVWGRITSNGAVLEPAFRLPPPTAAPTGSGAYRILGLAADGRVLFAQPVEPVHTMVMQPGAPHEEHFAAVLPLDAGSDRDLARIRLVGPGIAVERSSAQTIAQQGRRLFASDPAVTVSRPNGVQARIVWNGTTYPVAMVRDPATGHVLSFARGGTATIWTGARSLEITFSDGVRSVTRSIR